MTELVSGSPRAARSQRGTVLRVMQGSLGVFVRKESLSRPSNEAGVGHERSLLAQRGCCQSLAHRCGLCCLIFGSTETPAMALLSLPIHNV